VPQRHSNIFMLELLRRLRYFHPFKHTHWRWPLANFIMIGTFVLLGILFRRLKAFPAETAQVLNMFALYVSLPAVILLKVPTLTLTSQNAIAAVVPWFMLLLSAMVIQLLAKPCGWSRQATGALMLIVPIGNTSFMGVPMVKAFFGEAGIPHLILYDQIGTMLIFATYGSIILSIYTGESTRIRTIALRALLFPPTTALLAGLLLREWPYPQALVTALENLAGALTPLVMTAIGFQITLRLRPTTLSPLGTGLAVKLIIAPVIALLGCRMFGFTSLAADIAIFEAGMPPMVTASALAAAAGLGVELAIALAGLGIVLAFATLPLLYILIRFF